MITAARIEHRGAELQLEQGGALRRVPLKRIDPPAPMIGGEPAELPRGNRERRLEAARITQEGQAVEVTLSDGRTLTLRATDWPIATGGPTGAPAGPATGADKPTAELVVINIGTLCTITPEAAAGERLGIRRQQGGMALAAARGHISWLGPNADVTDAVTIAPGAALLDARGGMVTPGLIDPHAHPIFGGSRAAEFGARSAGASYLEIAQAGGGIAATVRATRAASDDTLVAGARSRLGRMLMWGTTTAEAKTGYALDEAGELRLLELIAETHALGPLDLVPTLLAAHALPPEAGADPAARAAYVQLCVDLCARARPLAESCDVYCDRGAFTLDETRTILTAARAAGLALRVHADQLAALGASQLAAELGALSVDHLEHLPDEAIPALARAGTVAVCLPGAALNIRQPLPPARKLCDAGVPVALGTDCNPGSSMTESLPLQMWLGATALGLSVEEVWLAVTVHAARALARPELGRLAPGLPADLVLWTATEPEQIPYHYGENHARIVIKAGRVAAVNR